MKSWCFFENRWNKVWTLQASFHRLRRVRSRLVLATNIEYTRGARRLEYGFETLLRRFRVGSLVRRSKFPYIWFLRTPFSRCPFFYVIRTQDRTHSRRTATRIWVRIRRASAPSLLVSDKRANIRSLRNSRPLLATPFSRCPFFLCYP